MSNSLIILGFFLIITACSLKSEMKIKVVDFPYLDFDGSAKFYKDKEFYKIVLDSLGNQKPIFYPFAIENKVKNEILIQIIEQLLDLEGDTRLCAIPISSYNPAVSTVNFMEEKFYSIQVEALFIINQIVFREPFNYSPKPVLVNKLTGEKEAIEGFLIKEAFSKYRKWFLLIKEKGIENIRKNNIRPLDDSSVQWLWG